MGFGSIRSAMGGAARGCLAIALACVPRAVLAQDTSYGGQLAVQAPDGRPDDREDALRCLALAVAYEAGNQSQAGQEAVAEVVMNRVAHPSFPKSVCGVVFQGWKRGTGCQFTFTCDGALQRRLSDRTITTARRIAQAALDGQAPRRVVGALNYHANYVHPVWAPTLAPVARIGAHIFYRPLPGGVPVNGSSSGQASNWEAPDHATITRAYGQYLSARYQADGAAGAGMAVPPPVASPAARASKPEIFAPWGLGIR